jgi:hypothetical protein
MTDFEVYNTVLTLSDMQKLYAKWLAKQPTQPKKTNFFYPKPIIAKDT